MTTEQFLTILFSMQAAQAQCYYSKLGYQWHEDNVRDYFASADFQATEPQERVTATLCTCPSGDGSLRWPCPTHHNP